MSKAPVRTDYELVASPEVHHPAPLPSQTNISVLWHYSDGSTTLLPGFRAWDFLGLGQFQAIEVLNEDGSTSSWVYDFSGEGAGGEAGSEMLKAALPKVEAKLSPAPHLSTAQFPSDDDR